MGRARSASGTELGDMTIETATETEDFSTATILLFGRELVLSRVPNGWIKPDEVYWIDAMDG